MNKLHSRIAVSSLFFLHGLCFSTWGARIPDIQEKLQLSEAELGSVLFGMPIGSLISMPIAAWAVSKFGSRTVLLGAITGYGAVLSTLGLADSGVALISLLVLFGFVSNFVNVSLNTQAIDLEHIFQRSIMASLHGLWSSAGFAGAALGSIMISASISPSFHFLTVFIIALIVTVSGRNSILQEKVKTSVEVKKGFRWPDQEILGLGLIAFLSMICEGAMFDWSGVYFKKVIGAQGPWVSAGYVAFMTTMAGTRFVADYFRSKIGFQKILFYSGILVSLGLLLSIALPSLIFGILGFLLVGAGVSAVVPLVMSEAGKSRSMSPSAAVAAVSTIGFLGFLIGPPMIGWIAGISGLRASFAVIAVMGILISVVSLKERRHA
jgi:MFS family permease